ncbi:glycoside hydrolase family 19 protein [Phytobacter ursingii]|uniref:glycoside hydrolase family 19 protein n=1 Tax=Phytobacter ursingii TaxID=1972431 RepID=UPI0031B7B0FE
MNLNDFQRAAGISDALAQKWFTPVTTAMREFGIDTPLRIAGFIAQTGHESQGFTVLSESLFYRDAIRVARFFRSAFDLNNDKILQPSEIAEAGQYTCQPIKLANRAYANRGGNGPESSGDGWRYRGRGLIQVTFKNNYRDCGKALGLDLLSTPDLLMEPLAAARSAAWYWQSRDCNSSADRSDVVGMTKKINPALDGLDERASRFQLAVGVLCR